MKCNSRTRQIDAGYAMPQRSYSTLDDLAAYERDGYVLVPQLFDRERSACLRDTAKRDRAARPASLRPQRRRRRQRAALAVEPSGRRPLWHVQPQPSGSSIASSRCLCDEPYHYHSKMIMKEARTGGAWAWHQDYGYWYDNGVLFPNLCSVFIAVDPATRANGCLQVLRGSHAMGRMTHVKTGDQTGADPERVAAAAERLELVYVEMEPGRRTVLSRQLAASQRPEPFAQRSLGAGLLLQRAQQRSVREGRHPLHAAERVEAEAIRDFGR